MDLDLGFVGVDFDLVNLHGLIANDVMNFGEFQCWMMMLCVTN